MAETATNLIVTEASMPRKNRGSRARATGPPSPRATESLGKRPPGSLSQTSPQNRKRRRGLHRNGSAADRGGSTSDAPALLDENAAGEDAAAPDAGDGFDDAADADDAGAVAMAEDAAASGAEALTLVKARLNKVEGMLETTMKELVAVQADSQAANGKFGASANFIKINVGGTVFTTRKSTLMRVDGTYLAAIASGRFEDERDEHGNVYIDRDPRHFQYILNWLRDPTAPQTWPEQDQGLLHELMFFGLKEEIVKGSIYVAYGFDGHGRLNTIECYNPLHRKWSEVAKFKIELSSPACAEMGGKMYITGGKNAKNRAVATVAHFDPFLKEITVTTDLGIARFGHGLVMLNNYIYAVGGYGDDGGRVACVERYSEASRKWETMPPLLNVRSALGCDALRGKIYVAGGYGPGTPGSGHQNELVKTVEMFDPKVKKWTTVAKLETPRAHVCCVTFQGKLWAVGGYDGSQASQVVEIYDPDLDKWIEGPPLRKKRSVVVCTVLGDTLYAIGGYDGQAYLSCAEMYDQSRKIWVTGPEMQVARGRHCVCTLPF